MTNTGAGREPGHVAALDGVRGLAILMVMWLHSSMGARPPGRPEWVQHLFAFGWMGVDLFFVLSGMLITGILLDTRDQRGYFGSFYARRTLRIFPLYYAALVVMLAVLPWLAGGWMHGSAVPDEGNAWAWAYLLNVKIALSAGRDVVPLYLFPFWSLAVEEQFYLVWPLAVWLLSRRALGWTAGGMIAAALLLRIGLVTRYGPGDAPYVLTVARMDALGVGALVALAARAPGGLARWKPAAPWTALACAAGVSAISVAAGTTGNYTPWMQTLGFLLLAWGFGALLVMVLTAPPSHGVQRVLSARWLRHLGARSYGLYVWHTLVVVGVLGTGLVQRAFSIPAASGLYPFGVAACVMAVSLAAAEVSWLVLEKPFLELKRYAPRPGPVLGPLPQPQAGSAERRMLSTQPLQRS
ncbi:acyltransferase family protein [Longimicrobium terrae]|uniref:Peptidoglycan/LPS O-acetylase OafA/YrhL n=1 Tax=Longimicrobium terrae TaxID=1639882 RepID=A0A841GNY6_9BACT|nr:acyltransferase [Longimicrobium terrae]MBB4634500.1 peptidoglycan/LPS O-acetylase OafA/YrhL [Longimicrobium terrae]MBB6068610.1 peptidoglycan/LPS O-acetylase OafA/YrhL [Longimicrobium terrae]NNC27796.1 acyltransferase [Longimicrobium terrae]